MFYTIVTVLLVLVLGTKATQNCVLQKGNYFYDLSPLSISSGGAYGVDGKDGDGYYFFNICGEVNQGACSPHQAVCQIGDAPHGCGDARDVTLEAITEGPGGVKVKYESGERCYILGGWPRYVTINVFCDPNATTLRAVEAREDPKCIYEIDTYSMHACPQPTPIAAYPDVPVNIFLVVHSHDDVGWLETLQGYYDRSVQDIIDNIVNELMKDEKRKFVQVEQAFFVKWWELASEEDRAKVRKLVSNRQITFPIGGWVMPDEATPSYSSLITQLTIGHHFLKQTFNYTPDVGWQIDPFGASHALAEVYKLSNFKGHVIDRIDWRLKNELIANYSLQFQWKISNNSEPLLTHILDTLYCIPFKKGMEYTHELSDAEVVENAIYAVNVAKDKARWTRTPHVLVPVGCDFAYATASAASSEYNALDKIIKYVTEHKEELNVLGIQYSTIDDYFDALHGSEVEFPEYSGDFFPFNDKDNSWWTGYFTSRPALKGLIRKSESILRASETLFSTARLVSKYDDDETISDIDQLVQAVSVNLHHDAITGTAKPHVVSDYTNMLNDGVDSNIHAIENMLTLLAKGPTAETDLTFSEQANITNVVPVVVYNSLPWERHDYVQIKISNYDDGRGYMVYCDACDPVHSQIMANYSGHDESHVLFFKVVLPPLGYRTYFIKTIDKDAQGEILPSIQSSFTNKFLKVDFSKDDKLSRVVSRTANIEFAQKFLVYQSYSGGDQQSGAYIFRTDDIPPFELSFASQSDWSLGEFVSDVYQEFSYSESRSSVVTQHTRIFHDDNEFLGNFLELSQSVGPLPRAGHGRELTSKFETSVQNDKTCFTDSNGLRFLERTYNPDMFLPLAGNHYPTVYASYFSDPSSNTAIGFVWDRAHGFSCSYGNAEVMLHRRCTQDDARGLSIPLDDDVVIDPVMRVVFGPPSDILRLVYRQMYLLNFRPIVTIGDPTSEEEWKSSHKIEFSILNSALPENVHVIDLKAVIGQRSRFILRLTHLFDYGEHTTLAEEVKLNMREFFAQPYCITNLEETHLTANQVKEVIHVNKDSPPTITLLPKQIRTFLIDVEEDGDNCANHKCGVNGKCIDLKCAYTCICGTGSEFDPVSRTCIGDTNTFIPLSSILPPAVLTYLLFVCAYSMRVELTKISELGRTRPARKIASRKDVGKVGRFMQANIRLLEDIFFPTPLLRQN